MGWIYLFGSECRFTIFLNILSDEISFADWKQ